MRNLSLLLSLWGLLFFSACSVNPVTGERDFVLISEDAELEMGRTYNAQVLQYQRPYEVAAVQNYVQLVGDSLSEISHRSNLVYRFTVLDSPDVNAFALPGGYIYINRGLMAYLSSEAELAAVLGHEIGHVTARHSVKQISQAQLLNLLSYAVATKAGTSAGDLANIASGALLAGYGRDMELQADSLGAEYMAKVGYSPRGMLDTISVLKEHEIYSKKVSLRRGSNPQTYHGIFSSHPTTDKRLNEVITKAETLRQVKFETDSVKYLKMIEGMVYGDSEADGIRRGNSFYHKDMDIRLMAPEDWEIINSPNSLIFNAPKGEAYLRLSVIDQVRKESPKEYLTRTIGGGQVYQEKEMKLGVYEAYTALLNNGYNTSRVAIVFKDKKIFTFYGTTVVNGLSINAVDKRFQFIVNSFRSLKETEKKLVEPLRLKLYKVRKGDTYSSLAKRSPIPFDPESKLRLLNGDYPEGNLQKGQLIKIVE